jgi:Fe-S-cluster containining protein
MGEAKRRQAAIIQLKQRSPEEAAKWRQQQEDKRSIAVGLNPESRDLSVPAAMARTVNTVLSEAKVTGTIDGVVTLFYETINATTRGLADIPIACKKGCSHCCYTWVSVSAPEALYIAKILKARGNTVIEKLHSANDHTKDYDFDSRNHAFPCPLLEGDDCSIYEHRPKVCRMAASADADVCNRSYHYISDEEIPMPMMYINGRALYAMAFTIGLQRNGLPHHAYEMNAALVRALETENAEQRWLAGEDIFAGIHQDPENILNNPVTTMIYEQAFPT